LDLSNRIVVTALQERTVPADF